MKDLINKNSVGHTGTYKFRLLNSNGDVKDEWTESVNTAVDEGLAYIQTTAFYRGSAIVSPIQVWYMGIYTGSIADTDTWKATTAATVTAVTNELTAYNSNTGDRVIWAINDAQGTADADRTVTNSNTAASFTLTGSITIRGAFICSSLKNDGVVPPAGSKLFSIANFESSPGVPAPRQGEVGDVLQVIYESELSTGA